MTWIIKNAFLTQDEMDNNAFEVYRYFSARGWTLNAIAGMLGNMQTESTINPGIWQDLTIDASMGYGLVQWTPSTKYTEWATSNGLETANGDSQCARIIYELENNLQWIATDEYPFSFVEFSTSDREPSYLADAFLKCYERPAEPEQPIRGTQANYYYELLSGEEPGVIVPTTSKRKKFNFLLFQANIRRRRYW